MIKVRSILLAIAAVTAIFAFAILPQLTGLSAGFNLQIEEDFQAQEQQEPFGIALINVSGCTNLTITNETYQLNTSLVGTQVGRNMCIDVQADNVTLDCLGLSLTNNDAISAGVESIFHNNLTMRNCNITDYYFGVNLTGTNNSLIENGFIISNDHTGIVLAASANVTVFNNTVYNNTFNGINVGDSSDNANISHNNITLSPFGIGTGVEIISANNASVTNNILAQQGQNSLRITSSNNSIIDNNIVADNGAIGLYIDSSTFFTDITNNNITNATAGAGIVTSGASYNRIENNTVTNSSTGINLDSGSGFNSLINNNVDNNFLQGIAISGTSLNPTENNTLINNTARNNSALDFFSEAGFTQNNTVINLEIGSVIISFTPEAISLRNGAEPATPLQDNLTHINKFINATNNSETSWLLLNVSYTDSDLTAANITNESSLFLAKHNGTDWITDTSSFANTFGVNTDENYVFANITNFESTFAPLGTGNITTPPAPPSAPTDGGAIPTGGGGPRAPHNETLELLPPIVFEPEPPTVTPPPVLPVFRGPTAFFFGPLVGTTAGQALLALAIIAAAVALGYSAYRTARVKRKIPKEEVLPALPPVELPEAVPAVHEHPEILFREKPVTEIPRMTEKGTSKYPEIIVVHTPAWQQLSPVFKAIPHKHLERPTKKFKNGKSKDIKRKIQYG